MVNVRTGEAKPHSPEFMATVQIPHDYLYYDAPCVAAPARILQFFHQVMAYEDVETVVAFSPTAYGGNFDSTSCYYSMAPVGMEKVLPPN